MTCKHEVKGLCMLMHHADGTHAECPQVECTLYEPFVELEMQAVYELATAIVEIARKHGDERTIQAIAELLGA